MLQLKLVWLALTRHAIHISSKRMQQWMNMRNFLSVHHQTTDLACNISIVIHVQSMRLIEYRYRSMSKSACLAQFIFFIYFALPRFCSSLCLAGPFSSISIIISSRFQPFRRRKINLLTLYHRCPAVFSSTSSSFCLKYKYFSAFPNWNLSKIDQTY